MTSANAGEDIPFGRPMIGEEEREAVLDVLSSPQLVHGPRARDFEMAFAESLGDGVHATSVSSCTAGLHLIYMHLGIGPGDEVIVPAQTHVATAHAVEITGAAPVFVDCQPSTGNIDVEAIERAITPRTRAVSVVHYLGLPADMDRVNEIARRHSLFVVEDCALAVGSRLNGIACGLLGDAGAFSFYPVKHMTTAEGGMVVSRHEGVVKSIENLKAFGYDRSPAQRTVPGVYDIARLGLNYRMNEISAAIGIAQLKKVPGFQLRRSANTAALRANLANADEVTLLQAGDAERVHSNYCLVAVLSDRAGTRRSEILSSMKAAGVGTSVYYPIPLPLSAYYRSKYGCTVSSFPHAAKISEHSIALPVGPHLNEAAMQRVAGALKVAISEVMS